MLGLLALVALVAGGYFLWKREHPNGGELPPHDGPPKGDEPPAISDVNIATAEAMAMTLTDAELVQGGAYDLARTYDVPLETFIGLLAWQQELRDRGAEPMIVPPETQPYAMREIYGEVLGENDLALIRAVADYLEEHGLRQAPRQLRVLADMTENGLERTAKRIRAVAETAPPAGAPPADVPADVPPLPDFPGTVDEQIATTELLTFAGISPDDVKIIATQLLVKYPGVVSTIGLDRFATELESMSDPERDGYFHATMSSDLTELTTAATLADAAGYLQAGMQLRAIANYIARGAKLDPELVGAIRAIAEQGEVPA